MHSSKVSDAYQIGEIAARAAVTPDTLRYYERLGLLPRPQRTSGGFRVYAPQILERLRFIKQAQTLGLTLHEIRDLVTYQDQAGLKRCSQVRDLLRTKLAELDAKLTQLQEFRKTLSSYLQQCERALERGRKLQRAEPECPVIETLRTKHR
jgi:DNA-binding transcriptional MerR regulator